MHAWLVAVLLGILLALLRFAFARSSRQQQQNDRIVPHQIGDITLESLAYYCGYDYSRPILIAVKGVVYDVTRGLDLYGPGKPLHCYAGKECSRAIAKGSVDPEDCSNKLHDLSAEELQRLSEKISDLAGSYDVVGQAVPMRELTLEELGQHSGADASKPLYLAIKGTVYDISKGKQFYGPDGVYPFAGRECARALALMSTDANDCNDNLEGLSYAEMETLKDWQAKFNYKYPVIGKLLASK